MAEAMPMDTDAPITMRAIIDQLQHHRATHSDWADWFEKHPDDPRAVQQFGDAKFHRRVEAHYTRMVEFLSKLTT